MKLLAVLGTAVLGASPLPAQFWSELANPKVEVKLLHPPESGRRLSRVALSPTPYETSRELADTLAGELGRDRRLVVSADAGAVVLVDVHQCRPVKSSSEKESKDAKGAITITRTATTTLEFSATLQLIDAGKVLVSRKFEERPSASNRSTTGVPVHPGDRELCRGVHRLVTEWLFRALLPWREDLSLTFFDDDAYKMDKAAARFKDGDAKGGLEWALRGEAEARDDRGGKRKFRERAFYNAGIARMALGDFEGALPALQEARDMNPEAGIFRDGLKACQRALEVKAGLERWERSAAPEARPGSGRDVEQRLLELDRLRRKGLITEEDFQRRKAEILREI